MRCSACEEGPQGDEDCQQCYWEQGNVLTDPFYMSCVKPFSYICSVFLVTSYIIGLWFSLRTHAAQIWEAPLHYQDYSLQPSALSLTNWRDNNPVGPFLKRISKRMSSQFLRGEHPLTDPANRGQNIKSTPFNSDANLSPLRSLLNPEDNAMFVQNVAEVTGTAATAAVSNLQSLNGSPPATLKIPPPPIPMIGPSLKSEYVQPPEAHYHPHYSDHGNADLAESRVGGDHDAPNWSRTKSSMILLSATILYAVIAGLSPLGWINGRDFGGYS